MIYKLSDRTRRDLVAHIKDADTQWPLPNECTLALDLMAPKSLPDGEITAERAAWLGDGYVGTKEVVHVLADMSRDGRVTQTPEEGASCDLALALLETVCRTAFLSSGTLGAHWDSLTNQGEILEQLKRVRDEVQRLKDELKTAREKHIREQMNRLGISKGAKELKLNIGAGEGSAPGWINVDARSNDLSLNIADGLPFEDASVKYIYSSHILEHFHYKGEAQTILNEFRRVLQVGGVARILVPDTALLLQAYARGDAAFFNERKRHFFWERVCRTPLEQILKLSGGSVKPGDFFRHKWGYDFDTLAGCLSDAGFSRVCRSSFMGSDHEELNLDNLGQSASIKINGATTSLFIEAVR